jgi:RimJ/RimL family protein N-acetyltransferase
MSTPTDPPPDQVPPTENTNQSVQYRSLKDALPLRGARLNLRLFDWSDADALYRLHRDPLLTRYAGGLKTREESFASLTRIIGRTRETGFGALAVEEPGSGRVFGWCGIQPMPNQPGYEVIYALEPAMWGRGYALEAASLAMAAAFALQGEPLNEIYGVVFPENYRSIRVLEKLGMQFVRTIFDDITQKHASLYNVSRTTFLALHQRASSSK